MHPVLIDDQLIADCKNNCRRAQKQLYKICFEKLMPVCYRYMNNELDARAQLNAGFLKICDNLHNYPVHIPFIVWARRIVINTIIDEYRKSKKYRENITFREHDYELENKVSADINLQVREYEMENTIEFLKALPDMTRKVFNLYVFEGYNHKEIGELLSITENTSKWHLHNGKLKIKALFELRWKQQHGSIAI